MWTMEAMERSRYRENGYRDSPILIPRYVRSSVRPPHTPNPIGSSIDYIAIAAPNCHAIDASGPCPCPFLGIGRIQVGTWRHTTSLRALCNIILHSES